MSAGGISVSRATLLSVFATALVVSAACGDKHSAGVEAPDEAGASSGAGGRVAHAGSAATQAGQDPGGAPEGGLGDAGIVGEGGANAAAVGGSATAGSLGIPTLGGSGEDPTPPIGDPPVCAHGAKPSAGIKLALSSAGDDLLQAVTANELTIAWKHGSDYFVAERTNARDEFGAPLRVLGGSVYVAVALRVDGLQLFAVTNDLSIVEITRQPGEAFDAANATSGDFASFNATLSAIPVSGQVLSDAVASSDETSFFVSHYTSDANGKYASVLESRRVGAAWPFPGADLGKILYASGAKRRVPTGLATDRLTLFYRDDVNGDFRAAWRVNTTSKFDYSEILTLGDAVQAAAPNAACSKLYFSAQGTTDLDLFVSDVTN